MSWAPFNMSVTPPFQGQNSGPVMHGMGQQGPGNKGKTAQDLSSFSAKGHVQPGPQQRLPRP